MPALDGLRGIAILIVMLLHFSTQIDETPGTIAAAVRTVFQLGWAGVDLFFVLSGFLITGILYDNKGSERFFRTFYGRRALRIFPLYYAALTIVFFVVPAILGRQYSSPVSVEASFWLYLANFRTDAYRASAYLGPLWSLSIEEQFYLVWPLVIYLCTLRQAKVVCLLAIAGAFLLRLIAVHTGVSGSVIYHFTPFRVDELAMGALVALCVRSPDFGEEWVRRWSIPAVVLGAAALIGSPLLNAAVHHSRPKLDELLRAGQVSALALLFAGLVARAAFSDATSRLGRVLNRTPLTVLGTYSYAMYVVHVPLLRLGEALGFGPRSAFGARLPASWIVLYPLVLSAVTLLVGLLSWHLFEKRFLTLKRYFAYESVTSPAR